MRIGILTSGGDAPGMNATLVGATLATRDAGHDLVAIAAGYAGLLAGRTRDLDAPAMPSLSCLLDRSGTVLGTSRSPDMRTPDGQARAARAVQRLGLDRLIVVGGAGSYAGATALAGEGVPVIVVPGTIDRDMPYDSDTIGTDSALNYAVRAIDDLRATAVSLPGRAFVIETLGGDTGHLARAVAEIACAPVVLVPEQAWDPAEVAERMRQGLRDGYVFVVIGEGVGTATDIARTLEGPFGDRIRPTTLGHSMRGARPSALDRALGLRSGRAAARLSLDNHHPAALILAGSDVTGSRPLLP
jgi:6-phosphofructokinase 1